MFNMRKIFSLSRKILIDGGGNSLYATVIKVYRFFWEKAIFSSGDAL